VLRILSAIILFVTSGVQAEDRLDQAIREFRSGLPERATFNLTVAEHSLLPDRVVDAARLRAFLHLYNGRLPEAAVQIRIYLAAKADPFLNLVLARILLDSRDFPGALEQYRAAASANHSRDDSSRLDLLPVYCGEVEPLPPFEMFRKTDRLDELWSAKLTLLERSSAGFQAMVLASRFGSPFRAQTTSLSIQKMPLISALLSAPADSSTHAACAAGLSRMEETVRAKLNAGSTQATIGQLRELSERKHILLRNRVFLMNDIASHILLGRYLNLAGKKLEAVIVFRAALRIQTDRLDFYHLDEHDTIANLLGLAGLLRDSAAAYGALDRKADQTVLTQIATEIESSAMRIDSLDLLEGLRARIFLLAGQNLHSSEALYLLRRLDPKRETTYLQKLVDRDSKLGESELLDVYSPIYLSSPPAEKK